MSNFLSKNLDYGTTISTDVTDILFKVAMAKEEKYNLAQNAIQNTVDQYGALAQNLRQKGKEYLAGKLDAVTQLVNNSGDRDLSKSGVARAINSQIKNIVQDPTVLNEVAQASARDNYLKGISQLKEKNDGRYHERNDRFAREMAGMEKWERGEIDKMGNLNYIEYGDYQKELKDISENLDKYDHNVEETVADGKGYFVTKKGKYLTPTELKNKAYLLLSDKAKRQMQVDGWDTYDRGATEEDKLLNVESKFNSFKNNDLESIQENLTSIRAQLKNRPDSEALKQSELDWSKNLKDTTSYYDDMMVTGNKSAMYTTMFTQDTLKNFANAYSFNDVKESMSSDSGYYSKLNYEYKVNKDLADRQVKEQKDRGEILQTTNPNLTEQDVENLYSKQQTYITSLESSLQEETQRVYEGLDLDVKEDIDNKFRQVKGQDKSSFIADYVTNLSQKSSNLVGVQEAKRIDNIRLRLANEKAIFNKYAKEARDETVKTLDTTALVNRLFSNPNIKIVWKGTSGRDGLFSAKDVLLATGIVDNNGKVNAKLSTKTGLLEAVQRSIFADKALSDNFFETKGENIQYIKSLAKSLGEDFDTIAPNNQYNQTYTNTGLSTLQGVQQLKSLNPNSKTARFLAMHRQQGGFNQAGIFSADDSFDDIPEIDAYLSSESNISKRISDKLAKDERVAINKTTYINPQTNTQAFNELAGIVGDVTQIGRNNSLVVNLIPSQPNMVRISQLTQNTKGENLPLKMKDVLIEDLPQSIKSKINFQNKKAILTSENIPDVNSPVSYGSFNDVPRVLDITQNIFHGDRRLAETTTKEGAEDLIFRTLQYQPVVGTAENPTETGRIIQNILNDDSLIVSLNKTKYGVFPRVSKKVGGNTNLIYEWKEPVDEASIEETYNRIKYAPQVYLNKLLEGMVIEKANPSSTNQLLKEFKKYYGN